MLSAKINEVFVSLQGEGPYMGTRQAFVRFAGCNLACQYCDTDFSCKKTVTAVWLLNFIRRAGAIQAVALTGGEPLVQADFLAELLPRIKRLGRAVYLETNGVLAEEFKRLHRHIDMVAMDIKLPSATQHPPVWRQHRDFIAAMCLCGRPGFIKIVLTPACTGQELARVKSLLADSTRLWTVVLQPEHSMVHANALWRRIQKWQERLLKVTADVRIIPQVHKLVGLK